MKSGTGGGLEGGESLVEDVELLRRGEKSLDIVDKPDRGDFLHHRPWLPKERVVRATGGMGEVCQAP